MTQSRSVASFGLICGKVQDLLASSIGLRHCHRVTDRECLHDTGIDRLSDTVTELSLADGSIKLTVSVGGAA